MAALKGVSVSKAGQAACVGESEHFYVDQGS